MLPDPPGVVVLVNVTGFPVQIVAGLVLNPAVMVPTLINPLLVNVSLHPEEFVVISRTVYEPGLT